MHYMAAHGLKRARPAELVPGTVRVITARMDYLPQAMPEGWQSIEWQRLEQPMDAAVSLYARGRDYHKVLRARLQKLADKLAEAVGPFGHRVFTDSAPVLEVELASRSGLGWRGKHTLLLSREAGSMFFLGEIYVDLALPVTSRSLGRPENDLTPSGGGQRMSRAGGKFSDAEAAHCGTCTACIDVCPTQAIVGERLLDARRCISYLTIEHDGPIPLELRPLMGNRIYGCDDCQLVCPWNKFARRAALPDFDTRDVWHAPTLLQLWSWDEATFLRVTEGSPIRRIGFERWQRNLAVALGNALRVIGDAAAGTSIAHALDASMGSVSPLVAEHVQWALAQAGDGAAL